MQMRFRIKQWLHSVTVSTRRGFCVVDDALPLSIADTLLEELQLLQTCEALRPNCVRFGSRVFRKPHIFEADLHASAELRARVPAFARIFSGDELQRVVAARHPSLTARRPSGAARRSPPAACRPARGSRMTVVCHKFSQQKLIIQQTSNNKNVLAWKIILEGAGPQGAGLERVGRFAQ